MLHSAVKRYDPTATFLEVNVMSDLTVPPDFPLIDVSSLHGKAASFPETSLLREGERIFLMVFTSLKRHPGNYACTVFESLKGIQTS